MTTKATPRSPLRRWLRAILIVVLATAAIVSVPILFAAYTATSSSRKAQRESIERLASAPDMASLDDAVGGLGVVLRLKTGEWIAISYRDSHSAANFFSSSVALCSDGSWMVSDEHYCGELGSYGGMKVQMREIASAGLDTSGYDEFFAEQRLTRVEAAASLAEAKLHLIAMGFRTASIDRTPLLTSVQAGGEFTPAPPAAPTPPASPRSGP